MNRNRDIVETRKLASKGRFGDNMIGEIGGKPVHINAYESYLLGQPGGEEAVKAMGAGTIHPETKLKEYWSIWKPSSWSWTDNPITDIIEYVTPSAGTDWLSSDRSTMRDKYKAKGVVGQGMQALLGQQEREMGPEGFITAGQQLEEEGIQGAYGTTMEGIQTAEDKLQIGTDLAYSGEVKAKIGGMTEQAQTQYGSQIAESRLKADKAGSDFMAGLRKQMNQLMMDYQSVSGEAYSGGSAYNELNTLFENYDNA